MLNKYSNASDPRNVRISHKEYIQDVVSSGTSLAFKIQSININPGLSQSFPWLSQISPAYMYYRVRGFRVCYVPTCAFAVANSTNVSLGFVLCRLVLDPTIAQDVSEFQMDNSYDVVRNPAYSPFEIESELKVNHVKELSLRYGTSQPANTDLRFMDFGVVEIASSGVVGTTQTLGKLYFEYDIEFMRPQIQGGLVGNIILTDHFYCTTVSGSVPLGTVQVLRSNSSIGGTINGSTGTTYSFPATYQSGLFLVVYEEYGTSATITSPVPTLTNCSFVSIWNDSQTTYWASPQNTVSGVTQFLITMVVKITAPSAVIIFGTGGTIPTAGTAELVVTQYNSLVIT